MSDEVEINQKDLLDQYKLYVEMADRISQRRGQDNRFYVTLLSALFVLLSLIVSNNIFGSILNWIVIAVGIFGILFCIIWYYNIKRYKELNSKKFRVIGEMETNLPFPAYKREYELIRSARRESQTNLLTGIEMYIPIIMALPYSLLIIVGAYFLCINCPII